MNCDELAGGGVYNPGTLAMPGKCGYESKRLKGKIYGYA